MNIPRTSAFLALTLCVAIGRALMSPADLSLEEESIVQPDVFRALAAG